MSKMKRYTILNFYVRGSSQLPQSIHGLNNLWKESEKSQDKEAVASFKDWAFNHETEVVLQGGEHEDMEALYSSLSKIKGVLSSKFNEPGNNYSCTVVSFVASARIIAANNYIRANRIHSFEAEENLCKAIVFIENDELKVRSMTDEETLYLSTDLVHLKDKLLTPEEAFIVSQIAYLPLAS